MGTGTPISHSIAQPIFPGFPFFPNIFIKSASG